MENVLNFTTHKEWILHLAIFKNARSGGHWESANFLEKKSPEEFRQIVLDSENKNRGKNQEDGYRNIIYFYWVTESEVMVDDRSKFGYANQSSTKGDSIIIPKTYVRGEVFTVAQALEKIEIIENGGEDDRVRLIQYLYDLLFDMSNPTEKELLSKIVKIPGDGERGTFFELFEEFSQISVFTEEELVPVTV